MITGYLASSKMLRIGGKHTDERGTTIVHPVERAAVVSSACHLLSMKGSAIEKHGLKRQWTNAAKEFARYALLRCDLVKPSRMNFKDALQDWSSTYTTWDRSPVSLSQWANHEPPEWVADNYRIVLLRQALGAQHSINIRSMPGTGASVFGGFLQVAADDDKKFHDLVSHGKAIVIDQPLTLSVQRVRPGKKNGFFIKDTWGFMGQPFAKEQGYGEKNVQETGRPGIFVVQALAKRRSQKAKRNDEVESVLLSFA